VGRKRNRKAPSVAGGAQKIPVRGIQRTRNLWFTPLKVDSRMSEAHIIVTVRLKPRMTILLERKRTARSRVARFMTQPLS
jgi:hypothetical protein